MLIFRGECRKLPLPAICVNIRHDAAHQAQSQFALCRRQLLHGSLPLLKKKPVPVVLSLGDETPSEVILEFPLAVVLHHFLKFSLPDSAILNFYDTLAQRVQGPVLLYNFPERTGYDLRPDLVLELATRHPNIVGIKDTVPNMAPTRALIQKVKAARPEFLVFSGFDEFFGHNVLSGGDGCIAGLSNFAPEVAAGYAQRARQDDLPGMAQYQRKVDSLMAIYDVAPQFVPTIKQAMALRGLGLEPFCAPPVLPSTPGEAQQVRALLQRAGLLE